MLHNSGPFGSSDSPINMSPPVNMPQMSSPLNISNNLSNLGKIAQPTPAMPSAHYNPPDYTNYSHPSINLSSQMGSFPNYPPMGFPPNFMSHNPSAIHESSWQNGLTPMNLHTQTNPSQNLTNYPASYDKRPPNHIPKDDYKNESINLKNIPITVPQVPTKASQKDHTTDNYGLFNVNRDRFNNFHQNYEYDFKTQERPLLDNTKRKSLENTVRLIEDILINTTRNKELQQKQEKALQLRTRELKEPVKHSEPTVEKSKETHAKNETVTTSQSKYVPQVDTGLLSGSDRSSPHPSVDYDSTEELTEDLSTKTKPTAKPSDAITDMNTYSEKQSSEPLNTNEPLETALPTTIEAVHIKIEEESDIEECVPLIDVKVEHIDWSDPDCDNPFQRDINGTRREDAMSYNIVDAENSVQEATAVVKSGSNPNAYYKCHCNLLFRHPKRFLIHAKWHSFGLTNERRLELIKQREEKRIQRKEAKIISKMNSVKEVVPDEKDGDCDGEKKFPCKHCDKIFNSKGGLKNHRQRYHPTRPRECKLCGAVLIGWLALKAHVTAHTSPNGYECPDCDKVFKYPQSLSKHRHTHLEKTVPCPECPKMFGTETQMKMHQKVHERVKRGTTFRCSYCAKGFYEAYTLAVHERTHRNERPFNCDICNTSFGTNSSLKRHLKVSHSSSKPFECSTCKRSFSTENIRDRHEARAHGAPEQFKFVCTQCDCRYMKHKDLQKHVYKVHPKGKKKKKSSDSE